MNIASGLTPFQIRVCAIEEGTGGVLRLPAFQSAAVSALARVDPSTGEAALAWMPLQDGLRLGLAEAEDRIVRERLYEAAARKLGGSLAHAVPTGDLPVIDVALPCLDKRAAPDRERYWKAADGRPEYDGLAQSAVSGWLAATRGATGLPPLEWTHTAAMNGAAARSILTPLVEAYGASGGPLPSWPLDARYAVDFRVTLDGAAGAGWYRLGSERTYDFFRDLSRVSCAVQYAVRRWLPVLWLSGGEMFDRPREAAALLAYSSLPAHLARSRRSYTYDPLDAASMKQALQHCSRRIQRHLQNWYPTLAAMNHPAAEQMHPRWHSRWAAEIARRGKRIQALLANEAWLIDQFVNYAAAFHKHAGLSELSGTVRRSRAMHASLDARFRRWWDGRQAQTLIGLVLLEATSALSASPVYLTVVLRNADAAGEASVPVVLRATRCATRHEDAPPSEASPQPSQPAEAA